MSQAQGPLQIAVVIPAYNSARFLREGLDSVLSQTYPVAEIIVVDDGSKDNTREVVESYAPPVRYFWQANSGVSPARNGGVQETTSPWVAFLDADDAWEPRKIERQVKALQANPDAVLCYTGKLFIGPDGPGQVCEAIAADHLWPLLRYQNPITPSTVLMRRDVFEAAGGFDKRFLGCEDWDLWFRLGSQAKMVALNEPLTRYRVTPTGLSMNFDKMLSEVGKMISISLIKDLRGWERGSWRRRAWSAELSRCAISAREVSDPRALPFLLRSLAMWPSPRFLSKRWKSLAVYLFRPRRA